MYTIALLIGLIFCIFLAQYLYERKFQRCMGHLPTLPRLPLIGSTHLFFGGGKVIFKKLKEISLVMEEKNVPFVVWVGVWPFLVLNDIDDCKIVATKCLNKPSYYDFSKEWLGDGLVTASGEIWKRNIKKIAGSFTRAIIDGYQEVFNKQAKKLVKNLKLSRSQPFDAADTISYITFETICHTALGIENISDNISLHEYYKAFHRTLEMLIERGTKVLYHPDFIYQRTFHYRELMKNISILNSVSDSAIKKRKLERKLARTKPSDLSSNQFKAVIDVLIDLNAVDPSFTEHQVRSEANTIVLGGQETAAITLSMVLLMLGRHPDVQDKLYEEMRNIFGDTSRDVTKEDLDRMVYSEAVINETLRLFPPVAGVLRLVDRDIELKSCTVPKGTVCALNIWGAGRLKQVFGHDAECFKPERWVGDTQISHMAFSVGKRACIGKRYATSILKTLLSHCVREFVFLSKSEEIKFKMDCTLKPISGNMLQVIPREK